MLTESSRARRNNISPFLFLSSQRRDESEETRGGREIKDRELERKTKQEQMRGDRQDGEVVELGGEQPAVSFKKEQLQEALRKSPLRRCIKTCLDPLGSRSTVRGIRSSETLRQDHSVRRRWRQAPPTPPACSTQTSLSRGLSMLNGTRVGA